MMKNIRIVLVEPSHPGNIGATARAMKNMGFSNLYLVNPLHFPDEAATARAGQAVDVLDGAKVCTDLATAIGSCGLVIGASARDRDLDWPCFTPECAVEKVTQMDTATDIAFVFGRERTGLTNQELQQCHYRVHIPTNPDYASLNLACAVQIMCYELRKKLVIEQNIERKAEAAPATSHELESYYKHLEETLIKLEFLDPAYPKQLMGRLRRIYGKAYPNSQEINILRGILTAVQKKIP